MFLDQFKTKNDGYHVIMNFIEITTRKAYAYPLKNKSEGTILDALDMFLEAVSKVENLTTDNGTEFTGNELKKRMKDNQINHFYAEVGDKNHMGKIERFNRTMR